jgi:ribose 5-phosphate isomerase A
MMRLCRPDGPESPSGEQDENNLRLHQDPPVTIADARQLAAALNSRAGIVEHGLFIDLATDLIVAGPKGIQYRARHS